MDLKLINTVLTLFLNSPYMVKTKDYNIFYLACGVYECVIVRLFCVGNNRIEEQLDNFGQWVIFIKAYNLAFRKKATRKGCYRGTFYLE